MPRIRLHVGAHKTATTYLQRKLGLNIERLATHGIHYDPLNVFRKGFTPLLKEEEKRENEYVEFLNEKAASMTLLVSEENILGVPGELVREGRYYGRASARLARTAELLRTDAPEIYLCLREYTAFVVSMYSEYIRHQKFLPFAEYREVFSASNFTWLDVIADIHTTLPGATITVWDFADFPRIEDQVFEAMLGFDSTLLAKPEQQARQSFSDAAIRSFEALSGVLDQRDMKEVMGPIARNLPKSDRHPAFDPLDADAKLKLMVAYKADLEAIAANYPEIRFLT